MRALLVLLVATALTAAACAPDGPTATGSTRATVPRDDASTGDRSGGGTTTGGGTGRFVRGLVSFDGCREFLDHVRAEARDRVGPYGLEGLGGYWFGEEPAEEPAAEDAAAPTAGGMDASTSRAQGGEGDAGFTGTNVQVAGVDEPDIVKTDGRRILTVSENVLSLVDISSGSPVLTDQLRLASGWGHELFVRGDRAILMTNSGTWGPPMPVDDDAGPTVVPRSSPIGPVAEIVEIDLSDPNDLRIVTTMQVEGQYLSARAVDDHVRIAMTTVPAALPWVVPGSPTAEQHAEDANRRVVESSSLDDWIPDYTLSGPDGTRSGPLLDCDRIHHPAEFAGFEMVSVLDLDLAAGLAAAAGGIAADAVGVLAGGRTVAASMDRFYVATTTWLPPSSGDASVDDDRMIRATEEYRTELHAFAIAAGVPTRYVASGSVPGTLLSQFSLDEHDGHLRVVHTDGAPWDEGNLSETFLTVLREEGDQLVRVGRVGGLGRGEQLYSARLMGDVGFAVTFRQVDPFYVLDLSDHANPRVVGELKIPGVSTYLHPIGPDHVLGIGQDALETGAMTGLKLSLFDVSDPADPQEVSVWTLPGAHSPAEWDHRAFQMWGSTAIVPVQTWQGDFDGVVLLDVGTTISEIARVTHQPVDGGPRSECRQVLTDQLTPDASELYWATQNGRVQVCGPDAVGGWGAMHCEPIPADELQHWFWDDRARESDLPALALGPGDVVEICWPDGQGQQIVRSLVADGTLYTLSSVALQANDLDSLAVLGHVPLR